MIRKILRCFAKGKWGPKVITMEKTQNIKSLALDDPFAQPFAHKMHVKEDEEEVPTKRRVTSNRQEKISTVRKMSQVTKMRNPIQ